MERWSFLRYVADAARITDCVVHAWCLLDNHVHLVATPPDSGALSDFVKRWAERYACCRNRRRGGTGKLFEQGFFSRPLRTDAEAGIATVYVDLNSSRAGVVDAPEQEPWSTSALHLDAPVDPRTPTELWTPSAWYLGLGSSREERGRMYAEWVRASEHRRLEYGEALGAFAKEHGMAWSYRRRLRRPDGSEAREPRIRYG